jgi:hypothetical protein
VYERLVSIINQTPLNKNLTLKYYAYQTLRKIIRNQLTKNWIEWRKDPNVLLLHENSTTTTTHKTSQKKLNYKNFVFFSKILILEKSHFIQNLNV